MTGFWENTEKESRVHLVRKGRVQSWLTELDDGPIRWLVKCTGDADLKSKCLQACKTVDHRGCREYELYVVGMSEVVQNLRVKTCHGTCSDGSAIYKHWYHTSRGGWSQHHGWSGPRWSGCVGKRCEKSERRWSVCVMDESHRHRDLSNSLFETFLMMCRSASALSLLVWIEFFPNYWLTLTVGLADGGKHSLWVRVVFDVTHNLILVSLVPKNWRILKPPEPCVSLL